MYHLQDTANPTPIMNHSLKILLPLATITLGTLAPLQASEEPLRIRQTQTEKIVEIPAINQTLRLPSDWKAAIAGGMDNTIFLSHKNTWEAPNALIVIQWLDMPEFDNAPLKNKQAAVLLALKKESEEEENIEILKPPTLVDPSLAAASWSSRSPLEGVSESTRNYPGKLVSTSFAFHKNSQIVFIKRNYTENEKETYDPILKEIVRQIKIQ